MNSLKTKIFDLLLCLPSFQRRTGRNWLKRWKANYSLAEKELSVLPQLLDKGFVAMDIGANRGEISYYLKLCGAEKIFSFEPQKRVFGILSGVAETEKEIAPFNIALSDSNDEAEIRIPLRENGRYTQAASIGSADAGGSTVSEKILTKTLDSFTQSASVSRLDFIKCDVEGHELSVFKGAQETLRKFRPILYIEIKDTNRSELTNLLKALGYAEYTPQGAIENSFFFPVEKYDSLLSKAKTR